MHMATVPGTDWKVSQIALGAADFGTKKSKSESFAVLEQYVAAGGNLLDTAHCYAGWLPDGLGVSERVVGEFLRSTGAQVFIATKGGHPEFSEYYRRPEAFMTPELIAQDFAESLERLKRDSVDLWYYHRDDPRIPVEELVDAAQEIAARYLGVSNWRADRLEAANAYARKTGKRPFVAWQNHWSLADPEWTDDAPGAVRTHPDLTYAMKSEVALIPYTASANGFFSGRNPGQFQNLRNIERRRRVSLMALEKGATGTQIALAWLMSHPFLVVPIIGTLDPVHLSEAIAASQIRLTSDELTQLTQ